VTARASSPFAGSLSPNVYTVRVSPLLGQYQPENQYFCSLRLDNVYYKELNLFVEMLANKG